MAISAEDKNFLVSLYVGYFNRAPDPAGLQFWIDQVEAGRDTNTIAADFAASPEAKSLYPFLTTPDVSSPTSFITAVYANLFNRAPDAAGQAFWEAQLSSGAVSPADAIDAIIKGATTAPDSTILANKNVVGLDFATDAGNTPGFTFDLGGASGSAAKDAISGVTEDSATVTAAQAATDAYLSGVASPGQTFTLTTGADQIVGTAGGDVIRGFNDDDDSDPLFDTFNPGDVIDGGAGVDTLSIRVSGDNSAFGDGYGAGATVDNVEILKIIDVNETGGSWDLTGFTGLDTIWVDADYDTSYYFYNLNEEIVSVTMEGTRAEDTERDMDFYLYEIATSLYTGDDDELTINVINAGSEEESSSASFSHSNTDGDEVFESYRVVVDGDDNYLYIENGTGADDAEVTTLTAVNAAGESGSLWLDLDEQEFLETVDASTMTGNFRFEFNSSTDFEQAIEVVSGSGDDNIVLNEGAYTVSTGAGDDRVELYTTTDATELGDDSLDGGDGTDIIAGDVDVFANADLADSTISNFEIIELSGAAGTAATIDADPYEAVIISNNLTGTAAVTIEGTDAKTVTFEEATQSVSALTFTSTGADDELTLSFEEEAAGTIADLVVADIEDVDIVTSTESDDVTMTTVDISGVEMLSFTGEGDIDIDGVTDDGSLTTLDLSAMEGNFDNNGALLDASALTDVLIGNLADSSYIDLDAGGVSTFSFTETLENGISIDGFDTGVGGDILDFSAFGIDAYSDLTFTDNAGNLEITADEFDGTITLVGTVVGDLDGAANFAFA